MITMKKFENGFEYLEISNRYALARVALQGAHLFHYEKSGASPLLWLSEAAYFEEGKAIRGGIPVCWPWFGPNKEDSSLPQHGFARVSKWKVTEQKELQDGSSVVVLELQTPWKFSYGLTLKVEVGERLQLSLTTINLDSEPFEITAAFHSYFAVSDISDTLLYGLEGCEYFDQLSATHHLQKGNVHFSEEIDRVYFNPGQILRVKDRQREIRITTEGSSSVVVWNPWIQKAASMKDMHEGGYREFVCVESANALKDSRILEAGMQHTLKMDVVY